MKETFHFINNLFRNSERKGVERKDNENRYQQRFETAYQQSIWKGLDLKQLITVGCFLPTVIGIMVALWYFLKRSAAGRRLHWNSGSTADPVFGTVQIPGNVYPDVMQRMEVSTENKETLWGNRN